MAEERRIIVEIVSTINNIEEETKEELPGSQENTEKKSKNVDVSARSLAMLALNGLKQSGNLAISGITSRYFSLSENYMAENDYNNIMTTIGKATSLAFTIKTGASVGGAVGAVIAGAAWGAKEFISYQNRMSGYYQALNATNYQTQFDRSRLGLTNEGKGTEN